MCVCVKEKEEHESCNTCNKVSVLCSHSWPFYSHRNFATKGCTIDFPPVLVRFVHDFKMQKKKEKENEKKIPPKHNWILKSMKKKLRARHLASSCFILFLLLYATSIIVMPNSQYNYVFQPLLFPSISTTRCNYFQATDE